MLHLETILHPTDFSPASEYAFRLACSLARDHGARLLVVHVAPPILAYGELVPLPPVNYRDLVWEEFHKLEETEPWVRTLRLDTKLFEGEPAEKIVAAAKESKADLVVMGTHGRTGLRRILMGSVAEEVLRLAPCPVLTVKAPQAPVATPTEPEAVEAR